MATFLTSEKLFVDKYLPIVKRNEKAVINRSLTLLCKAKFRITRSQSEVDRQLYIFQFDGIKRFQVIFWRNQAIYANEHIQVGKVSFFSSSF